MTISTTDLETATKGRLGANDPETARLLEVGLAVVRAYCGWHVSPDLDDTLVLDGRGGLSLRLPTLNLVELTSLTEDGDPVDLAGVDVSWTGRVTKQDYTTWTDRLGGIEVQMRHGFTSAPAWESAVITYIARTSMTVADGGRQRTAVGPFTYATAVLEDRSAFTGYEQMLLDLYRLEPYP